jgi:DNA-binding MarR family transcriptional regulator
MVEDIVRTLGYLCLGTRMKRIGERLQAETQQVIESQGMGILASQFPYLAAIDRLGPLTIGDLAEAIGITQPGATRAVIQLAEAGFVVAEMAPDDQRRRIIRLSDEGRKLVDIAAQSVWPLIEAAVRNVCGDLRGPLLDQLAAIEDSLAERPLQKRATTIVLSEVQP